ncbi:hypothetical protein J1614_003219 [Plenodomus biglobosus]|nr:hypothetical protein J1614_003219 [Plenodomus biglobosus]
MPRENISSPNSELRHASDITAYAKQPCMPTGRRDDDDDDGCTWAALGSHSDVGLPDCTTTAYYGEYECCTRTRLAPPLATTNRQPPTTPKFDNCAQLQLQLSPWCHQPIKPIVILAIISHADLHRLHRRLATTTRDDN